ncbi:MAG: response regulator, partial [Desulfobacteraceae bacterium]|nr:response regulator [Desulfobacteraceae bacterium]
MTVRSGQLQGVDTQAMNPTHRLLIIDDNEEVLEALGDFFSNRGYDILSATNGKDGLLILRESQLPIDVVITDLVMPQISGVAVIAMVKEKYPDIPVIAITGWGESPRILASQAKADLVL